VVAVVTVAVVTDVTPAHQATTISIRPMEITQSRTMAVVIEGVVGRSLAMDQPTGQPATLPNDSMATVAVASVVAADMTTTEDEDLTQEVEVRVAITSHTSTTQTMTFGQHVALPPKPGLVASITAPHRLHHIFLDYFHNS